MRPHSIGLRMGMLIGAILVAMPLAVASRLEPNREGLGTHQQLGLPPCSIRMIWGMRCPACGMTTSWAFFVRGQVGSSLQANIAGTLLAVLAVVTVGVLLVAAVSGRMPQRVWLITATWGLVLILVIAAADWAWRST